MIKHNATWQYEYSIKDHLGNVRATFCDLNGNGIISNNERRSRLDYYTFGLEHYNPYTATEYSASKNLYRYNGKQKVEEMGWNNLLFGARNYDASIGRFSTLDPSADEQDQLAISPYTAFWNNPIRFNDPDGRFPIETIWDVGNVIYDVGSAVVNHIKGNHQAAKSNWADAALDAGAVLIPYVPAGASKAIKAGGKAAKAADKASDAKKVKNSANVKVEDTREGKIFTKKEKEKVIDENRQKNNGEVKCENCGVSTTKAEKSQKGITPPKTDAQVDHIIPRAKGGKGKSSNGQVLCRDCNIKKSDKIIIK